MNPNSAAANRDWDDHADGVIFQAALQLRARRRIDAHRARPPRRYPVVRVRRTRCSGGEPEGDADDDPRECSGHVTCCTNSHDHTSGRGIPGWLLATSAYCLLRGTKAVE